MLVKYPDFENYSSKCSENPDTVFFNRIYFLNACYLLPTLLLLIWMIIIVRIRHRDTYHNNLVFAIFTIESIVAIIHIILDLFIVRLFLYFPQFCSLFSPIFINYPMINNIIFPLYNYCRVFKTVSQSAIILSRLYCVKRPMAIDRITKRYMPIIITVIMVIPLLVIFNTVVSRKEVVFWYGGFFTIYHRWVGWVSLSFLHLTTLFLAIITIIFTSLDLYSNLPPTRNPVIERTLFINASFAVFGFILQGIFQSYYSLFRYREWFPDIIIHGQFVIYDVMTVGCPLLMFINSSEFRGHLFSCRGTSTSKPSEYIEFQPVPNEKTRIASRKQTENISINFDSIV